MASRLLKLAAFISFVTAVFVVVFRAHSSFPWVPLGLALWVASEIVYSGKPE